MQPAIYCLSITNSLEAQVGEKILLGSIENELTIYSM